MTQDTATRSADLPLDDTDGETETLLLVMARAVALQQADAAYKAWQLAAGRFSPLAPLKALAYHRAIRDYVTIEGRLDLVRPLPCQPDATVDRRVSAVLSALDLQGCDGAMPADAPAAGTADTDVCARRSAVPPEPWSGLTSERLAAMTAPAPATEPVAPSPDPANPFLAARREAAFIAAVPRQDPGDAGGGTAAEYRQAIASSLHLQRDELIRVVRLALSGLSPRDGLSEPALVMRQLYDQIRYRPDQPDLGSQRYRDLRAVGWSRIPIEQLGPLTALIRQARQTLSHQGV